MIWAIDIALWLSLLGLILNDILREPGHREETAKRDQNPAAEGESIVVAGPSANIGGHTEEQTHRAEERRYWRHQARYNRFVGAFSLIAAGAALWAAIVATGAYTASKEQVVEAKRQADAADAQTKIARENFHMDQRPYLLVEDIRSQALQFKVGENAAWNIQYINYGKSPSLSEATEAHVWVGRNAATKMEDFFRQTPLAKPANMASFVTPPNASGTTNGFHYVTIFSDEPISADDMAFIKDNDAGIIMAGRVWYFDIFGDPHSTDFCRRTLKTGAVSDCPIHTEVR